MGAAMEYPISTSMRETLQQVNVYTLIILLRFPLRLSLHQSPSGWGDRSRQKDRAIEA